MNPEEEIQYPDWLDEELPLHFELELVKAVRTLEELDRDALTEVAEKALEHNFQLVNIAKQSLERVQELEHLLDV